MTVYVTDGDLDIITICYVQWMSACDVNVAVVVPHMASTLMMMEEILNSKESKKGQDRCNPRCPIRLPSENARQDLIVIMDFKVEKDELEIWSCPGFMKALKK
jgi:hypothetical protein